MITADEAREFANDCREKELEPILKEIKILALKGDYKYNHYSDQLISGWGLDKLRELGFKVKQFASTYRDEGNQLTSIEW